MLRAFLLSLLLLLAGSGAVLTHCETDAECESIITSFAGLTD
jgi:hypothetical protein